MTNRNKNNSKKSNQQTTGNLALQDEAVVVQEQKPDPAYVDALLANVAEVNGVRHCVLPVDLLEVDDAYQRPLQNRVRNLVANWNPIHLGEIYVNLREGHLFVVDGQNRVEAAKIKGVGTLMCRVTIGATKEEEAENFATQDDGKTTLSSYDKFHALCVAKNGDVARQIKSMLDKYHIVYENPNAGQKTDNGDIISRAPALSAPGRIGGLSTIMKIGRIDGMDMVDNILSTIQMLHWHTMHNAYSAVILKAFQYAFQGRDVARVKEKLYHAMNGYAPDDMVRQACLDYKTLGQTKAVYAFINSII